MKKTSDPRNPFEKIDVYEPEYDEYLKIVYPDQRIIFENKAAKPGANLIKLIMFAHI